MSSPAPSPRRWLPRSRAARVALGGLALVAVLACTFRWNWCGPWLRHYVMARSGRAMTFDDLQVHFRHGLDPTIELRNLTIQNAPWAATPAPFIRAGRIALTLSWRTLADDVKVIEMIELEDAQVDMERQADGLRNWRITRPDDRGPPRLRVLALDARDSTLHTIHRGIGLEATARTTPLATAVALPNHADLPLTRRLAFSGTFRGHAFAGDAQVSDVLTFGATPRMFALKGTARLGGLRLDAAGLSSDVHALGDVDLDATVATDGPGPVWPLPEALARVRPLVARGHVTRTGERVQASDLHVAAGRHTTLVADAVFTGRLHEDAPRRALQATLRDAVLDIDDLSLLRGKTPPDEKTLPGTRPDADHALSTQPLPFDRLRALDADIDLRPARIVGSERGFLQTLRAHARLEHGVLRVAPLDIGLADGHVDGTLQVDAAQPPAALAIDVSARGLRIDQLSATLAANGALAGAIDGRAVVKTRGESSRALVAGADGTVSVSLADGATVSRRLDAKLGLNAGEWLRTLFDKSARVPVQCAQVTLALARGVATPRRFVFETPDTALAVQGSLDLADERIDATLTPAHKKLALLALDKSIHAAGSWHDVKIKLEPSTGVEPARCP